MSALAVVLGLALALALGACGLNDRHTPSASELALERRQLVQVASGLGQALPAIRREVGAARIAWPSLADGLPPQPDASLRGRIARAGALARAVPEPPFMAHAERLTGPAAGLGGLYGTYARLCERAWRLTETSISTILAGPSQAARFAQANVAVYLDAIYDSHYDLSLVGKGLAEGYARLGGPSAFGSKLPSAAVRRLRDAYSIAGVRLEPHPGLGAEPK